MCKWLKKLFSPKEQEATRKFKTEVLEYHGRKGITANELQRWLEYLTIEQVKDTIDIFNKEIEYWRITRGENSVPMTDKPILELKSGTEVKKVFAKASNKITIEEDTYFIVYEDLFPLMYGLMNYSVGILKYNKAGKEVSQIINITKLFLDVLGCMENPNYQPTMFTKI